MSTRSLEQRVRMSALLIETSINLFEAPIHLAETHVNGGEAFVNGGEAFVNGGEASVNGGEALVDLRIQSIQAIAYRLEVIRYSHSSRHRGPHWVQNRCPSRARCFSVVFGESLGTWLEGRVFRIPVETRDF